MTAFILLRQTVEVHVPTKVTNRFGDEVLGPGKWEPRRVAGWAINSTQEQEGDSVLRTIDRLVVYMGTQSAAQPDEFIRLPDGSVWRVEGNAQNFDHGPWWQPGLVVVTCTKTEG